MDAKNLTKTRRRFYNGLSTKERLEPFSDCDYVEVEHGYVHRYKNGKFLDKFPVGPSDDYSDIWFEVPIENVNNTIIYDLEDMDI